MNDFGAVKLDTNLTAPHGAIQLVHGCIRCSSRNELGAAKMLDGKLMANVGRKHFASHAGQRLTAYSFAPECQNQR